MDISGRPHVVTQVIAKPATRADRNANDSHLLPFFLLHRITDMENLSIRPQRCGARDPGRARGRIALFARRACCRRNRSHAAPISVSIVQRYRHCTARRRYRLRGWPRSGPAAIVPDVTIELPPALRPLRLSAHPPSPPVAHSAGGSAAAAGPMEISDVAYLHQERPHYPAASRSAHEEGLVLLRVLIDITGHAQQSRWCTRAVIPGSMAAACEAVARTVFKPYIANGVAREALATVPVEFSLRGV